MPQQQTLSKSVSFTGTGLHHGNKVTMTLHPGPPSSGIRFRRVDLDGKPEIEARAEYVVDTQRSTTLGKGPVRIHTVEHVLAAFAGAHVHNAVIELDANEPPIADGSAREFARLIREAGTVAQTDAVEPFVISTPMHLTLGEAEMAIFPHDGLKISCTSTDQQGRFTQYFSVEVTPETWESELAHARTFCFFEEIEFLIRNGLIRGGSLENAIVIRDDAVLTNEPLRYPDEFVRHKVLDILGDLSLIGRPLQGHILAVRPSHHANSEFAKALLAQARRPIEAAQTFAPPPEGVPAKLPAGERRSTPSPATVTRSSESAEAIVQDGATLDIMQVMKVLPHRPPFLMVDKVTRIDGNTIVAQKNVTIGEGYFEGHFPGHPIMPGVLQLEAIAQVAGILMMRQAENAGKLAYFMSAEDVKWRRPVRPGDTLVIEVQMTKSRGRIGKARGRCLVDDEVVSEADVTFMLVDR